MIKIEREEPPKNTALDNRKEEELKKIEALAESGELKSSCIKELWSVKEDSRVKEFLYKSQCHKCCYCEKKLSIGESDVEHFRPKAKVKEARREHQGYWWLAYNWENLLIACSTCNRKKGTRFPLKEEEKRAYTKDSDLDQEEPSLINPLVEDPEQFISYGEFEETRLMVKAVGKSERGKKTVNELTGINDKFVLERRKKKLEYYDLLITCLKKNGSDEIKSMAYESLLKCISRCSEFSGFARFYFEKEGCL